MKCSPQRISTSLIYLLLASFCQAVPWTNSDGKVIEADFVRLDETSIILRRNEKEFQVSLNSLSKDSQGFAHFIQQKRVEWATTNAATPIITEQILQEITALSGKLTEGKSYLVEGVVKFISDTKSTLDKKTDSSTAIVELTRGTKVEVDFAGIVDNYKTKIKVEDGKVYMMKCTSYGGGGAKGHRPVGVLLQNGQKIVIRATITKGKIITAGRASDADITEAKLLLAKQNGGLELEEVVALENIKNRIEFLESQINGVAMNLDSGIGIVNGAGTLDFTRNLYSSAFNFLSDTAFKVKTLRVVDSGRFGAANRVF